MSVLCAEYNPARPHGEVTWRVYGGLPVIEVVNNWECASFTDTYRPDALRSQFEHALRAVQPDVVHVHSLFNLSFDVPTLAKALGCRVVATLHDYTLVCPSGGQRVHRAEEHRCTEIDPERCARCFRESPYYQQVSFASLTAHAPGAVRRAALQTARRFPVLSSRVAAAVRRTVSAPPVSAVDIAQRLARVAGVVEAIDLFVSPSQSLGEEFERLGISSAKLRISDNGLPPMQRKDPLPPAGPLRIGFIGMLVWHKGAHVLVQAVRQLEPGSFQLKLFGDPGVSPEYATSLRAQAQGLPVQFMGRFNRDDVAAVFASIDVLVVPSLWPENSPLVIHEAHLAGVPVIGARIGGIGELVTHGLNGLLYEPDAVDQLVAALRDIVEHPEQLEVFRRAIPRVKTIAEDAADWEARYSEVLAPPMVATA